MNTMRDRKPIMSLETRETKLILSLEIREIQYCPSQLQTKSTEADIAHVKTAT